MQKKIFNRLKESLMQAVAISRTKKKDEEILQLHRKLAAETLRANQGWERYESANRDRNDLRNDLAKSADPKLWTIAHDGHRITVNTLTEVIAAARKLRTPEEQLLAAQNLMKAVDEMLQEPPEELVAAQKATSPFATWWATDKEIALHFIGSGASTSVTAGQIRKMLDAIYETENGNPK